ncbi:hypothetical protein [Clostridium lundense]|uniref:hypothetical protein n=1 Tax=Clostridium lundense TaxID=319475 RepID=UPI000551F09A|nr:hypothetical protein [Clostridium lundense]
MYIDLDYNEVQSIQNLINNRINELRIDIDGDTENEDEFKEIIRSYKKLLKKMESFKNEENNILVKDIEQVSHNENLREKINKEVWKRVRSAEKGDKTFEDILPSGFENILKVYVYNNKEKISKDIKGFMQNDKVNNKIKDEINKFINSSNPMISKFINGENISNKIIGRINNYFDDSANMMEVIININSIIDKLKSKKVADFLMYVPYEGKKSLCNFIADNIIHFLDNKEIYKEICFHK